MLYVLYGTYGRFYVLSYILSGTKAKRASKIKPCAIREVLHRRKYRNYPSVIYGMVKPFHRTEVLLPVLSDLPQISKPDGVLF